MDFPSIESPFIESLFIDPPCFEFIEPFFIDP